jgi:hypothetical protein
MHECPDCGQTCDCDMDDTWFDDFETYLHCSHDCEEDCDDFEDDLYPEDDDCLELLQMSRDAEQAVGASRTSHTEDNVVNVGQAQDEQESGQ